MSASDIPFAERWPSGRRRRPDKALAPTRGSRVRIPPAVREILENEQWQMCRFLSPAEEIVNAYQRKQRARAMRSTRPELGRHLLVDRVRADGAWVERGRP